MLPFVAPTVIGLAFNRRFGPVVGLFAGVGYLFYGHLWHNPRFGGPVFFYAGHWALAGGVYMLL